VNDEDEAVADVGRAGGDHYQLLLNEESEPDPRDELNEHDEQDA
jgi:hypothetical protein